MNELRPAFGIVELKKGRLRGILKKKYGGPVTIDRDEMDYLEGLRDAGVTEAGGLMRTINKLVRVKVIL